MIIECENCLARFRLDESKIPEGGRKVRCSKCQHVFWAYRPPPPGDETVEEAPREEAPVSVAAEEQATFEAPAEEEAFEPTVKIDLEDREQLDFDEEAEEFFPPTASARKSTGRPLLVAALIILILVLAGIFLYQRGMLPFLSPAPEPPTANLIIDQNRLDGKWEKNVHVSRIFVIKGTVRNQSKKTKGYVKVRGVLLGSMNKTLRDTWAFSGNPIPDKDLRTKAKAEILARMRNRDGLRGMNKRIAPGSQIPFTIVFFDVPEGVESYGAEVIEATIP